MKKNHLLYPSLQMPVPIVAAAPPTPGTGDNGAQGVVAAIAVRVEMVSY